MSSGGFFSDITNRVRVGGISDRESEIGFENLFGADDLDPAYVPDRESFDGFSHTEIWHNVHEQLNPTALAQTSGSWKSVAEALQPAFDTFKAAIDRELASWSGTFAPTAQQATTEFVKAGQHAVDTAGGVSELMDLNSQAATVVKGAIPSLPAAYVPAPDSVEESFLGGMRRAQWQQHASDLEAEAQDAMTNLYNPTMPASGDNVRRFVQPPPGPGFGIENPGLHEGPDVPGNPPVGPGNGPGGETPGGTPAHGGPGAKPADAQPPGGAPPPGSQQPQPVSPTAPSTTQPASAEGVPGAGRDPGSADGPRTTAAGVGPVDSRPGYGGGGLGSGGLGSGSGLPGLGSSPPMSPYPGKSIPGQPLSPAAQAAARAGASAPGTPGASMGEVPHGRKDSEAERTKGSPEYLRRQYEELATLPPAGIEVIGDYAPEDDQPPTPETDVRGDG